MINLLSAKLLKAVTVPCVCVLYVHIIRNSNIIEAATCSEILSK